MLPVAIGAAVLMTGCAGSDQGHQVSIAAVGPLTGAAAARGKDMERAVRMAVDEVNSDGGVNGRHIHLTVYDDGDQPARGRELARQIAAAANPHPRAPAPLARAKNRTALPLHPMPSIDP